jgi:hypothetical protein
MMSQGKRWGTYTYVPSLGIAWLAALLKNRNYLARFYTYRRSGKNTRYDLNNEMWFCWGASTAKPKKESISNDIKPFSEPH